MLTKAHCFTITMPGRASVLETKVSVRGADIAGQSSEIFTGRAIWDTGATGTVITQKAVDHCGLKPIGMVKTLTVNGEMPSEVFLVGLRLPNGVVANRIRVTVGNFGPSGPDILIGMDIIGHGDFAVTSRGGKTIFSFRIPSMEAIDFQKSDKKKLGRNDPCPCGCGKKFKDCGQ